MKRDGDTFTLASGTKFDANCGIIGICDGLSMTGGYDDGIWEETLSPADIREISDYMIALWTAKKEKAGRQ